MDNFQNNLQQFLNLLGMPHLLQAFHSNLDHFISLLASGNIAELSATAATSFALIAVAEIGDKSQLVCMTLAIRHRATPVLLGAIAAFAFLNTLAVVFGIAIASWLPEPIIVAIVGILFAVFGVQSLRIKADSSVEEIKEKTGHGIFFSTFLLITLAEFGDKTQLAVVALSSAAAPLAVWLGSTLALAFTSALGVLAGRTLLKKVSLELLHKISGSIFLVLSAAAFIRFIVLL